MIVREETECLRCPSDSGTRVVGSTVAVAGFEAVEEAVVAVAVAVVVAESEFDSANETVSATVVDTVRELAVSTVSFVA